MSDIAKELDAILHRAAIAVLNDRAFLRVTGSDATRWLNGMATNSIQSLAPGEGCYNFLLNAQGRIQADCTIYREPNPAEPPSFLLQTDNCQLEAVRQHLDHFIIMDDVNLEPLQPLGIEAVGPAAHRLIFEVSGPDYEVPAPAKEPLGEMRRVSVYGRNRLTLYPPSSSHALAQIQRGEIWCFDQDDFNMLNRALPSHGFNEASPEALEALRILEARPLYGRDITDKYLPQETNQPQALHFAKGCYLGQEIVERIRSRGQVHRLLTPLTLTGSLPQALPTPIESDSKPVGEITSAALVPLPEGPQLLALGYVRREALDTRAALTYSGGSATPRTATNLTEPPLTTNH